MEELIEKLNKTSMALESNGYTRQSLELSEAVLYLKDQQVEIERMKAELKSKGIELQCLMDQKDHEYCELKAKLSEQVDPIELIKFTAIWAGNEFLFREQAEKILQQFKNEKES